jgi:hypothetical protein
MIAKTMLITMQISATRLPTPMSFLSLGSFSVEQRLYQLVPVGIRADLGLGEGQADDALHLFRIDRHRRRNASGEGRPVAVARGDFWPRETSNRCSFNTRAAAAVAAADLQMTA